MAWNIEQIKDKLQLLEDKAKNASSESQKLELLLDINNYKDMINFYEGTKVFDLDNQVIPELNNDYIVNSVDYFKNHGRELSASIVEILSMPRLNWKTIFVKRPDFITELELVDVFLKQYNPIVYEMFSQYKNENRIQITNNKYETTSCVGKCHYIVSEGESYISVKNNHQSYLAHELAHAYLFQSKKDINLIYNMVRSCLSEAYSIFTEYAYLDFLKQTKYRKYAINEEAIKLDSFICALDYGILDINDIDSIKDYYKRREIITLIISHLVAVYWLDLYKQNKLGNRLQEYENNLGIASIEAFFEKEDINEMVKSLTKHYNNYKKC